MARLLIVGGGCRARRLSAAIVAEGHAVRIVTREESGRAAIEATGAECLIGTPDRLATLRAALEGVTLAWWLLGTARGPEEQLRALHGTRLRFFLGQTIDTTVRGFVYEACGTTVPPPLLAEGAAIVTQLGALNAIPVALLTADPCDLDAWLEQARAAAQSLLGSSPRYPDP